MDVKQNNVLSKPLAIFSKDPMTGFFRNGYCQTGPNDSGDHSIAATVTDGFLNFSAARGNNLRPAGLSNGCKWCLCSSRWKEAVDAAARGELSQEDVPKVHLHASNESALKVGGLQLDLLKKYAAAQETGNGGRETPQSRKGGLGGAIREKTELANPEEMTARGKDEL